MTRDYEKELSVALAKITEIMAENIALCSMLDDARKKIEDYESK